MRLRILLTGVAAALLAAPLTAQDHANRGGQTPPGASVPLYDNLGALHRAVSTTHPLAQRYFDQGLRLAYGFNHAEAIAAFRQALAFDSTCAMCWWGIAWAFGPNINGAMDSAGGIEAYAAIRNAERMMARAAPVEQGFVRAMLRRYGSDPLADRGARDSAYAAAMGDLAARHPEDADAQILHAEALMLLRPWDYWTEDLTPRPGTETLLRRLEDVINAQPDHPGACHFYIHAVEAAYPERALPCAERLPSLMPGAGHIVHMPAHIYIRVGRYGDAITANVHAVHADEQYIADRRPEGAYPLAYYPHNYHFLEFAAQMAGQSGTALEAARKLARETDRDAMRLPGMEALQHFLVTPLRVMVRFGLWDRVLAEPAPPADLPYPMGTWYWARGMALVRKGDTTAARRELGRLETMRDDRRLEGLAIWGLNGPRDLLAIAAEVLSAELASAGGAHRVAVAHLRRAVGVEDRLLYDEPPTWELPVRHYLGAALLAAGQPAEAETVYRRDLEKFPNNGWALIGLAQALSAQQKPAEAARVRRRLAVAWRTADVELTGSRF